MIRMDTPPKMPMYRVQYGINRVVHDPRRRFEHRNHVGFFEAFPQTRDLLDAMEFYNPGWSLTGYVIIAPDFQI